MSAENPNVSGALNLLKNCLDVRPQNKVLLVCEDPKLGWYDAEIATLLANSTRKMGAIVSIILVGTPDDELPTDYADLVDRHDTIIYLARLGDQHRFHDNLPGKNVAMLYARDAATLSSTYASTDHRAMEDLKAAIDQITRTASHIKITCPLGTELDCQVNPNDHQSDGDVVIKRFPLCVPQPVLAKQTSGKVALANWLTPTGSNSYSPASCKFDSVVFAEIERGRIVEFQGEAECVKAIKSHYKLVSEKFDIDKDVVHSWHAGIHSACSYAGKMDDDPDRWSNNIFGSPRFLHFHTCGDYPPGEICWMVFEPTIEIDGIPLWQSGLLMVENFKESSAVVQNWPELNTVISGPAAPIGIDRWF